jgi:hypothetical protein
MPKEPENLVLNLLREMRGDVSILRERADEHSEELRALCRQIHDWSGDDRRGDRLCDARQHSWPGNGAGDRRPEKAGREIGEG